MKRDSKLKKRILAGATALIMLLATAYIPSAPAVAASGTTDNVTASAGTNDAITVTLQPADVTTEPAQETTFIVRASGSGLKYQWYFKKDNADTWTAWNGHITAKTAATANVTWDGMLVRCEITDSDGNTVTSDPAEVKVNAPTVDGKRLYGSVRARDILEVIEAQRQVKLERSQINLPDELKEIGSYDGKIELPEGVVVPFKVWIGEQAPAAE